MTKKRKHKKQEQKEIVAEIAQRQQHLKLRCQIATMKRLPNDFRDITLGTDWEAFATITGRRKEMNDWWNGPILCLAPLNEHETMILGSPNKLIPLSTLVMVNQSTLQVNEFTKLTQENWIKIIQHAECIGCSWIYLPDEELPIITALNVLFSHFGFNIRAKGQLMSEHTGKPVGVVR